MRAVFHDFFRSGLADFLDEALPHALRSFDASGPRFCLLSFFHVISWVLAYIVYRVSRK